LVNAVHAQAHLNVTFVSLLEAALRVQIMIDKGDNAVSAWRLFLAEGPKLFQAYLKLGFP